MPGRLLLALVLIALLVPALAARAQGGGVLTLGEWVEGSLTATEYEHHYAFQGTAGTLILAEMRPAPNTYDLDPALQLFSPERSVIAENDDFALLDSVLVARLPADGDYILNATRSGGAAGDTAGPYILRVAQVEALQPGDSVQATIFADFDQDRPTYFVLAPETTTTWAISYRQESVALRASLTLRQFNQATLFDLQDTSASRAGTLQADLEGGVIYLLAVERGFSGGRPSAETSALVTIDISQTP